MARRALSPLGSRRSVVRLVLLVGAMLAVVLSASGARAQEDVLELLQTPPGGTATTETIQLAPGDTFSLAISLPELGTSEPAPTATSTTAPTSSTTTAVDAEPAGASSPSVIQVSYPASLFDVESSDDAQVDMENGMVAWRLESSSDAIDEEIVFAVKPANKLPSNLSPDDLSTSIQVDVERAGVSRQATATQQLNVPLVSLTRAITVVDPDGADKTGSPTVASHDMVNVQLAVVTTDGADTGPVTVVERFDPEAFAFVDSSSEVQPSEEGALTFQIAAANTDQVSYTLEVRVQAQGATSSTISGSATSASSPTATKTTTLDVVSPVITGSVSVDKPRAEPGSEIRLNVELANSGEAVSGPLTVVAELVGGQNVLGPPTKVNMSGQVTGDSVTWKPDRIGTGSTTNLGFSVQVASETLTQTTATWRLTVTRPGEIDPFIETGASSVIAGGGSNAATSFSQDTLARLVAFLVGLSVLAVIFGAWAQTRRKDQIDILRVFIEGIAVVVLISAILILVMGGGLEAESGASLLGVIAGYVFGRASSRKNDG